MSIWMLSVTDPFVVFYAVDKIGNKVTKLGTTEALQDNLNPAFTTSVVTDYLFEAVQEIVIKVFHMKAHTPLNEEGRHELIGEARFELGRLMRANAQQLNLQLTGAHARDSTVTVRAESQVNTRDLLVVTFSGNKLANKDGFFGTSDPFLVISRLNEDNSYTAVWTSNKIDNSLNPRWAATKIPMVKLCNGDLDRPLCIELFDWDKGGRHQSMGAVRTSVRGLLNSNNAPFEVIEEAKKGKKGYTNSGTLVAANCSIEHHPTFAQYIAGGMEVSLMVAIDFTGSNGDPTTPSSLHHLDPAHRNLNPYQDAIKTVGAVLEPYDADKKYNVYGFGARVRG
ncbi:hypothetical protein EON64_17725, partial [archaeon]